MKVNSRSRVRESQFTGKSVDHLGVGAPANHCVGGRVSQVTVWATVLRHAISRERLLTAKGPSGLQCSGECLRGISADSEGPSGLQYFGALLFGISADSEGPSGLQYFNECGARDNGIALLCC